MDFAGKNILVAGGNTGTGLALSRALVEAGATVITTSRQEKSSKNPAQHHRIFDAKNPQWEGLESVAPALHGFVYAPGTILLKPFHRLSVNEFQDDFQVNVVGLAYLLQQNFPLLKAAGQASVVTFSTVAASIGMGFHASVAASKSAVEGLSKSLAAEWAPNRIRVNVIAPSLTQSPMAQFLLSSPEKVEASNKRHPLGRVGTPEDLVEAALYLLSDKSSWVTGQVFHVDGGISTLK